MSNALSLSPDKWSAASGHLPSFDGIRGISVLIVLIGHMILPEKYVGISALGLDCFFLVSGFLITRLFFAEFKESREISLAGFYKRRLIRLYPVLIFYMLLVVSIQLARHNPVQLIDVGSVFFYYLNYLEAYNAFRGLDTSIPIGVLWSLSIEEHFYLFMPLVVVLLKAKPVAILRVSILICVASLAIRYLYVSLWPGIEDSLFIYRHSETRFDSIAYGVALASLCEMETGRAIVRRLVTRTAFITGLALLLLTYVFRDAFYQNTIRFSLQSIALAILVSGAVFGEPFRFVNQLLNSKILSWVGNLSYSLYIWHGGCMFLFAWLIADLPTYQMITAHVVLTFILASCSYYLIERPMVRWGRRVLLKRKSLSETPSQPYSSSQMAADRT